MFLVDCIFSVMRGIGEMDVNQPSSQHPRIQTTDDTCPYLVLDLRDRDEYDACHIIGGKCYMQILFAAFILSCQFIMGIGILSRSHAVTNKLSILTIVVNTTC